MREMGSTEVLYLKMTRFILFLCMLLYSSSDVSTILVNSSSEVTSSYSFTSWVTATMCACDQDCDLLPFSVNHFCPFVPVTPTVYRSRLQSSLHQSGTEHKTMPYRYRAGRKWFSVKTGTVMQSLKLGLQVWALASYLLTNRDQGAG